MTPPVAAPRERSEFQTLNGLRGAAAIAVMIYHFREILGPHQLAPSAYLAVDLFFLMSGFVIAHAYDARLATGRMSLLGFLRARIFRLYPIYFATLMLGISYFIAKVISEPSAENPLSAATIGMGLLGMPMFWMADRQLFPFNPASWSLFFEMVANLIYALAITRLSNRVLIILVVLTGLMLAATAYALGSLDHGSGGAHAWAGFFRVGFSFTLGVLMWRMRTCARALSALAAPLALLISVAIFVTPVPTAYRASFDLACVMLAFPTIILLATRFEPSAGLTRWFKISGEISYPVYLLHGPAFLFSAAAYKMLSSADLTTAQPYLGIGVVFGVLAASYAIYCWYDVPVRRLLNQAALSMRAGRTAQAQAAD